jgi:hypothetical protein
MDAAVAESDRNRGRLVAWHPFTGSGAKFWPRQSYREFRPFSGGLPSDWGSGIDGLEQLSEAGTELAVEAGATDLEQEIGAAARPSHLLGFGHAAVDQEVGGAFGEHGRR